jgi:hypothetical protein
VIGATAQRLDATWEFSILGKKKRNRPRTNRIGAPLLRVTHQREEMQARTAIGRAVLSRDDKAVGRSHRFRWGNGGDVLVHRKSRIFWGAGVARDSLKGKANYCNALDGTAEAVPFQARGLQHR